MIEKNRGRFMSLLLMLFFCAFCLTARIVYLFLADAQRFPINTIKITASYQHLSRKQIEDVLSKYLQASFFSLEAKKLQNELSLLDWVAAVDITRIWPDTVKIRLDEKTPYAWWNHHLLMSDGQQLANDTEMLDLSLPQLIGPENQQTKVLQIYQKLSKLLERIGLQIAILKLYENQAWELVLSNGTKLHLGKQDIDKRLTRFCQAYRAGFSEKSEQLESVDLRYAHGMAVKWKQQTGR